MHAGNVVEACADDGRIGRLQLAMPSRGCEERLLKILHILPHWGLFLDKPAGAVVVWTGFCVLASGFINRRPSSVGGSRAGTYHYRHLRRQR